MSLEGADGGEPLNVSWQVIPRLCNCHRKGFIGSPSSVNFSNIINE